MDLEKLLEQAEPVGGGVTNDVWATDGEIIKRYSDSSPLNYYLRKVSPRMRLIDDIREGRDLEGWEVVEGVFGNEDLSPLKRIENEKMAENYYRGKIIGTPEVLHSTFIEEDLNENYKQGHYAVFERVDGRTLGGSVEDLNVNKVYDLAKKAGQSLMETHENGYARRDSRPENLMFTDGETPGLYWIDNEFFTDKASEYEKSLDVKTFLGEARTYPPAKHFAAAKGFDDGYELMDIYDIEDVFGKAIALRLSAEDIGGGKGTNSYQNILNEWES